MKRIIVLIVWSSILSSCSARIYSYFLRSSDIVYENGDAPNPGYCDDQSLYLPDTAQLSHFPMRYVRVNVHFMRHPNDVNFFDEELARTFAEKMISCGNYKLSVNAKMNLPKGNDTEKLPARYRYTISPGADSKDDIGVYIHEEPDSTLAYFYNEGPNYNVFDKDVFDKYGIRKKEVLNIFVLSHPPGGLANKTYKDKQQGVGYTDFVKVAIPHDGFSRYDAQEGRYQHMGRRYCGLLNHEIGHSLGLRHTWNTNDGCDDTPQNPGCWGRTSSPPCNDAVSNNMMDYNSVQDAISPCQLYNIFYKMANEKTAQRKILEPTWCTYKPSATITIYPYENIGWKAIKDLEGDVIIESSGVLTIYCRVSLPKNARILVKAGGKLIIDGGTITNVCDELWEGVEVVEKPRKKGTVIIRNGGKIENQRAKM